MKQSTAFFGGGFQNGTDVPFINKHSLTFATFPFLRSMVTEYCARQFFFFQEFFVFFLNTSR